MTWRHGLVTRAHGNVFMDIETRSHLDLRKVGGRRYAAHPSTEITVACFVHEGEGIIWVPHHVPTHPSWVPTTPDRIRWHLRSGPELPDEILGLRHLPWVAHNAHGFDRHVWEARYPGPREWIDSLPLARRYALPGSLDGIGESLYGQGKHAGRRTMLALAVPHKKTGRLLPLTKSNVPPLAQYCAVDVLILVRAWRDHIATRVAPGWEERLLDLDRRINDRGVSIDISLAEAVIGVEEGLRKRRGEEIEALTLGALTRATLRSVPKFRAWLKEQGLDLPDARRDTLLAVLEDPDTPAIVRAAIEARVGETRITSAKLQRAVAAIGPSGRVHDVVAYHAAHTGRWGGRKLQPHNLPRPAWWVDLEAARRAVLSPDPIEECLALIPEGGTVSDLLASLIRLCIVPTEGSYLIADFASVEARGLRYLAGDEEGLEVFRQDLDLYKVFASKLYGIPYEEVTKKERTPAKVAELGAGYQMSGRKLGAYASGMGIDLSATGWSGPKLIEAWRDANPLIAGEDTGEEYEGVRIRRGGLWRDLQYGVADLLKNGGWRTIGRCRWFLREGSLICQLPSRRELTYRNARLEDVVPQWGGEPRPTIVYDKVLGKKLVPTTTYGGKLTENCVQAFCRDLLGHALLQLDSAGFVIPLHVHDEGVGEGDPDRLAEFTRLMTIVPSWAKGFPLKAEGFVSSEYRKDPPPNALRASAMCGKVLECMTSATSAEISEKTPPPPTPSAAGVRKSGMTGASSAGS